MGASFDRGIDKTKLAELASFNALLSSRNFAVTVGMKLIRVFPRRTKASPLDPLAYFGPPDLFAEADEVHISVAFTYDKPAAERLAEQWRFVAPVKIGGVAYGDRGEEFVPGRYVKDGYIFTSRGCPRKCWFCSVWKRDPVPRLLPVVEGWNILDDNLLACPRDHVEAVFAMLRRQDRRIEFTGGLEALALEDYHGRVAGIAEATPDDVLRLRSRRCLRNPGACRSPAPRCRVHPRIAPHAGLRADRLSEGHLRPCRGAAHGYAVNRLYPDGDAVAA